MIKQKLVVNIEKLQTQAPTRLERVFVLSLPMNEIHELGLMYINYEILLKGYKVIYLGESMPIENLKDLKKHFNAITFVSYLTVQPDRNAVDEFVAQMSDTLLDEHTQLWYIGRMIEFINKEIVHENVSTFNSITELVNEL